MVFQSVRARFRMRAERVAERALTPGPALTLPDQDDDDAANDDPEDQPEQE